MPESFSSELDGWSWDDIVSKVEDGAEPRYSPWYERES